MRKTGKKTLKSIFMFAPALAFAAILCWPVSSLSQSTDFILVGAGDVADGVGLNLSIAVSTAAAIDGVISSAAASSIPVTVFAAGDLAYDNGSEADFANSYDTTWGKFRTRTLPAIGNHEYQSGGAGHYNYFGPIAGSPNKGYYSTDIGNWHIVVLNSNCNYVGCSALSPQGTWLSNDLNTAINQSCTLAIWHHPLYSSTSDPPPTPAVQPLVQILYSAHAELIVNGHAHVYERFAPQDANGNLDTANGVVQITVGTGGETHHDFSTPFAANSLVRDNTAYGVLKMTLHATSLDYQFMPAGTATFTDSGSIACH